MAFSVKDWHDAPPGYEVGDPIPIDATPLDAAGQEDQEVRLGAYVDQEIDAVQLVVANTRTSSYTFVLADGSKAVESNLGSAIVFTVPPNSSVAFPIGTVIEVHRYGAGGLSLSAGGGVTIRSPGALLSLRVQYSTASLRKRGTDEWVLAGDLA